MSLPREILDQLLSGYLDDSLSADERARVERLLETDPEFAREHEELRGIRGWLKDVAKADSVVSLPEGFSDRVLDAAIACAKSEGLSEDHPLVRLAEQPSSQPATTSSSGSFRFAAVLVALAASIVIAVFAFRPDTDSITPAGEQVAMDPGSAPTVDPIEIPESVPSIDTDRGPKVVAVDPKEIDPVKVPDEPTVDPDQPGISLPPLQSIVSTDPPKIGPEMVGANLPGIDMKGGVMVIDVRLTDKGRETEALKTAMRAAGITAASEKQITDEIVGLTKDVTGEEAARDGDAAIIYLQAWGTNLDNLYLKLFEDREGIESVGLGAAFDAPLIGMVDAFQKIDPKLVRSEVTWELASDSNVVKTLATELGNRKYLPMDRKDAKGATAALSALSTKGEDFPSQLILLVR